MSTYGQDHRARQVLVVEDDLDHQTLMRLALDRTDRYAVVAVAATARCAVTEASRMHPDVVLLDLHLRDTSAFDSLPEILVRVPTALVVAISADTAPSARRRALGAGAFAFLAKSPDLYVGERLAVALDRLTVQFDAMLAGVDVCVPVFPG